MTSNTVSDAVAAASAPPAAEVGESRPAPRLMRGSIPRALLLNRFPGLGTISVLSLVFLYLPMLIVVAYSFNGGNQALIWQGFSLRWYSRVFTDPSIINATKVSLQVAAIATVASTVLAVLYVLAMDRLSRAGSAISTAILAAPIVVPEVVMGVATLAFIRLIGLSPGFIPLVLAHTSFCVPFAMMNIRARYSGLNPAYFESAADLGAPHWTVIRRIMLPLLMPGIVSGALLAFVVSMDDFMISNFLASAGSTTLPIYIFGLIRKGVNPSVNVVATLLLILAVVVTTATTVLTHRQAKNSS
ncbi:MAG: ABC transporter permease [Bifidobacteriaceae bacterium]|jgi:spermidine/putrescine transport system permease protein|nr:ABC transporter permease [Bifidobacteriaceae bacterium]